MQILTEWRIKVYTRAIVAVYIISALVIFLGGPLSGKGLFDIQGKPLGSDFLGFFTAASLAKAGHATWAYNLAKMHALEKLIISPAVSTHTMDLSSHFFTHSFAACLFSLSPGYHFVDCSPPWSFTCGYSRRLSPIPSPFG